VIRVLNRIQSPSAIQSLLPAGPSAQKQVSTPTRPADQLTLSKLSATDGLEAMERFVMEKLAEAFPGLESAEPVEESEALYASGASAAQVAGTIFSGVTQVIFGAYEMQHPDMSEDDFEQFIEDVRKGIKQGVGQARSMLESTDSLGEETSSAIEQTLEILHERMNSWFSDTRSSLFPSGASKPELPGKSA
jgi:hypothetical protein